MTQSPGTAIYVEGLTVAFGRFVAIRDLDFLAAFGEVHAVIGPNGAGKTTLLDVLTGKAPFAVNYIQGVVKVPVGFGKVASVRFLADAVEFTANTGEIVRAPVRSAFVFDGKVAGSDVNR